MSGAAEPSAPDCTACFGDEALEGAVFEGARDPLNPANRPPGTEPSCDAALAAVSAGRVAASEPPGGAEFVGLASCCGVIYFPYTFCAGQKEAGTSLHLTRSKSANGRCTDKKIEKYLSI